MSVRPIDFNGMIQQTHEVGNQKTSEDNQGAHVQQNVTVRTEENERMLSQTVLERDDAGDESYRLDANGGGTGHGREGRKKKKNHDGKKRFTEDGSFTVKNKPGGFNITI